MKTTLSIDDAVVAELKREAARQGRTVSELVETALRLWLRSAQKRPPLTDLPKFEGGEPLIDIANRGALYDVIDDC